MRRQPPQTLTQILSQSAAWDLGYEHIESDGQLSMETSVIEVLKDGIDAFTHKAFGVAALFLAAWGVAVAAF